MQNTTFGEVISLIRSKNRKKHTDKPSKWNSMGGGLSKHYKSGNSPQHPKVKAQRMFDYNQHLEEENKIKEQSKPKMYESVNQLFKIEL